MLKYKIPQIVTLTHKIPQIVTLTPDCYVDPNFIIFNECPYNKKRGKSSLKFLFFLGD